MSGYTKTNWIDDVTPLSSTNLNNIEKGIYKAVNLDSSNIEGTDAILTKDTETNKPLKVEHIDRTDGVTVIRTDTFLFSDLLISETRTWESTGETRTFNNIFGYYDDNGVQKKRYVKTEVI